MTQYRVIKRTFSNPEHPARWVVQGHCLQWRDEAEFDSKREAVAYAKKREGWAVAREKEVYRSGRSQWPAAADLSKALGEDG